MSKRAMESTNDNTGKSRQNVQSYQPGWMAHWMRTSGDSTARRPDPGPRNDDDSLTIGLKASKPVKEPAMIESSAETESLRMSAKSLVNEVMSSSVMKHGEDEIQAVRPIFGHNAIDCKVGIQYPFGFREYQSIGEGSSMNPIERVKTHVSAKDTTSATSTHMVPYHELEKYGFDKGKAVVHPLINRSSSIVSNTQFPSTKLKIHEQEHCQSASSICERKMVSHSESECFRNCNTKSLLLEAPSMNEYNLPKVGQDLFKKIPRSGISLLPYQEKNEQKISHYDHYTLHKMPNCVHDMETMRICTTVDSVEAVPGGLPRFSQTTHSLLITKKTDVNILKENDMFRRLITKMNGKPSSDVYNLAPLFGQANRGVKLQPLSSSSNSGEIGIGTSKVATKNESSAETDTLDMDFFKEERPNSGENSTRSIKSFNFGSSREVGHRSTALPDINLELPALPITACSSENAGHSSSRTQSLEMDVLLAHAEQPTPKSNLGLDDSSRSDPTTRWVKRLKLSTSGSSSRGTKSSDLAENSYHGKKREFFRKILQNSISSSKSTPREHHDKDEDFTLDPARKCKEMLFSHAWIKRWLHNGSQTSQKKPETPVVYEPQSSKLSMDELQKKQFPSIAAMALMGKTMGGLQSCELKKGNNFTVWNTKAF